MNWVARNQPAGSISVHFGPPTHLWMHGGWPTINKRPEYQQHGWTVGQAVFKIESMRYEDFVAPIREAFPTATINGRWVFLNRHDYAMIKLAAQ